MKHRLIALSLASALLTGSNVATAADYTAGTLAGDGYENLVQIKAQGVQGKTFNDSYSFTVAPGATFVSASLTPKASGDGLYITDLSLQIFDGADNAVTGPMTSFVDTLSPGSYYFRVTGTTMGHAGGKYTFFASAVPEASSWQLIALGVGILALRLGRRGTGTIKLLRS